MPKKTRVETLMVEHLIGINYGMATSPWKSVPPFPSRQCILRAFIHGFLLYYNVEGEKCLSRIEVRKEITMP